MFKQKFLSLFVLISFFSTHFIKAAEKEKSNLIAANLDRLPQSGSVDYFTGNLGKKIDPQVKISFQQNCDRAQIAAFAKQSDAKRKKSNSNSDDVSDDEKKEIKRQDTNSKIFLILNGSYQCPLCQKSYSHKAPKKARPALLSHFAQKHGDSPVPLRIQDIKCTECEEVFCTGKERKKHTKDAHK